MATRRALWQRKRLTWAVLVTALLMVALILTPADLWNSPVNDVTYRGFDSNLMYATGSSDGSVTVAQQSVGISAIGQSQPSINLATTRLRKLTASVDVTVLTNSSESGPVRIGVWSPWTRSGYFVVFGPAPEDVIRAQTVVDGAAGPTLLGGHVVDSTDLRIYELGSLYHINIVADRVSGFIRFSVTSRGVTSMASIVAPQLPALFGNVQMSLTASTIERSAMSHVVLSNYVLTIPHQRSWASRVSDSRVTLAVVSLAALGGCLVSVAIAPKLRRNRSVRTHPARLWPSRAKFWLLAGAVGLYLGGNAALFPLGGHPFDFRNERLYGYIARSYGIDQLYFLSNVTSLAKIWGGVPFAENAFPYGPVIAFLFTGLGWTNSLVFAGGGPFSIDSASLGYLIKTMNVLFGLIDAVLIYLILRELKASLRWSLIGAAFFLFNPAVWFSMSVWGQTHVISICFVLAAVLFAEKRILLWAWLALTAACLTRPQMVVFGFLIGIALLRKFSIKENVVALSWTVIVIFMSLVPLSLAIGPSLAVDIMLHNWYLQEAGGNEASLATVSQSAYSIWPLVTYLVHGASGLQRAFTSSSTVIVASLTYQTVGQFLTIAAMLLVGAALMLRKRAASESGGYLPLVALGVTSFLMLLTGIVATSFLLALPLLLLCRRWMSTVAYLYVAVIWTVCTLVPMYGDMGHSLSSAQYPLLASAHNPITRFFVNLYAWDRFITVGVMANIVAVVWLAVFTFGRRHNELALSSTAP